MSLVAAFSVITYFRVKKLKTRLVKVNVPCVQNAVLILLSDQLRESQLQKNLSRKRENTGFQRLLTIKGQHVHLITGEAIMSINATLEDGENITVLRKGRTSLEFIRTAAHRLYC